MRQLFSGAILAVLASLSQGEDQDVREEPDGLRMSAAVACAKVTGYRDYTPLDEPAATRDDKLLLYFEPAGHTIQKSGHAYRVSLTEDAFVRRRGEKTVLMKKNDVVKYDVKAKEPPVSLYLSTAISLKSLPPGEYEVELVLHDKLAKDAKATQRVEFRVKPSPAAKSAGSEKATSARKP